MTSTPAVRSESNTVHTAIIEWRNANRSIQKLGLMIVALMLSLFGLQSTASAQCSFFVGEYNVQFDWQGSAAWAAESGVGTYVIGVSVVGGCPAPTVNLFQPSYPDSPDWPVYEPPLIAIGAPYFSSSSGGYDVYGIPLTIGVNPFPATEIGAITVQEGSTSSSLESCENFTGYDHNPCYITVGDGPNPGCSFKVTDTDTGFSYSGGPGTLQVTATPNSVSTSASSCTWTAYSTVPWITINSGSPGAGSGTVSYTVTAESAGSSVSQAGMIVVAGTNVGISQGLCQVPLPSNWTAWTQGQSPWGSSDYDDSYITTSAPTSQMCLTDSTDTQCACLAGTGTNCSSLTANECSINGDGKLQDLASAVSQCSASGKPVAAEYIGPTLTRPSGAVSIWDTRCDSATCYGNRFGLYAGAGPTLDNLLTPRTMSQVGCGVTALAMCLSNAGVSSLNMPLGTSTALDPGSLNDFMSNWYYQGFVAGTFTAQGGVHWLPTVNQVASNSSLSLQWDVSNGGDQSTSANGAIEPDAYHDLDNALCNSGVPIIVRVSSPPHASAGQLPQPANFDSSGRLVTGHFVVVTGKLATEDPEAPGQYQYSISDPAGYGTTLDDYALYGASDGPPAFVTVGSVVNPAQSSTTHQAAAMPRIATAPAQAASTDLSSLEIAVDDNADVLVKDPEGNESGFDPMTGNTGKYIPTSAYQIDTLTDDDTGDPTNGIGHSILIPMPMAGSYLVTLTGINELQSTLTVSPFSTDGSVQSPVSVIKTLAPGATAQYQVTYNPAPGSTPVVTPVVPPVTTTPGFISFPSEALGSASAAQTVTLSNSGSVVVNLYSIGVAASNSGDFSQTNTCGATIAVGANCTISVRFTPAATGTQPGAIVITDDASNSPQLVGLNGIATAGTPAVAVTPTPSSITTAQALSVTVAVSGGNGSPTPTGSVTLSSGPYISAATTLTAGSATINVPADSLATGVDTLTATYTPDSNSASTYNSAMGTNTVTVTAVPVASFALTNNGPITFEASTNTGNTATIAVAPANGFTGAVNLTCAVTTTPANPTNPATCGVTPSVTITGASSQNATLTVTTTTTTTAGAYAVTVTGVSGAISMPTTVTANVGAYVAPTFTLTNGGAITISSPGAATGNTTTITVMPSGGFTGSVTLTAALLSGPTGAVDPPTFSFGATSPVGITGASNGTGTLTVTTTAATTGALVRPKSLRAPWYAAGGTVLACLLFFGIPGRFQRWRSMLGIFLLLGFLVGSMVSCGGGAGGNGGGGSTGNPGTTVGIYAITITGTAGSITQTTTVNLTVN